VRWECFVSFTVSKRRPQRLLAALLCCLGPAVAAEEVVVTGSREAAVRSQVAGDLVVIDAGRIRASGADSLEDLLRREAGLQLSRNGGPGQPASLFLRGTAGGQTLLLVDGVRTGSATLGAPEFDILSLASIERVEVLRGPASSLYGADAVGGVVQVFTRRGEGAPRAAARAAVGGYGAREASLAADLKSGPFDLAAGVSRERAAGVSALRPGDAFGNFNPDRDGFDRRSASARFGFEPVAGRRLGLIVRDSRLDSRYDASEFLPPSFAQDASGDFRSRGRSRTVAGDGRADFGAGWSLTARVAGEDNERNSGASAIDRFASERRQAEAQLRWQPQPGQRWVLAVERSDEKAESSSYAADAERDNHAVVLAYTGTLGPAALQAEARRDRNSAYGTHHTGRLGARVALGDGLALRALAGNSFKAPSFNDLVFPGFGVPTLRPERGASGEIGADAVFGAGEASLTVYRQRLRDLIAYEPDAALCPPDPAYAFGCARNVRRARIQGATLTAQLRWSALPGWQLRGTLDWLDATDADSGARLPRRAANQQSLGLGWRGSAWSAGADVLRVGARPDSGAVLPATTTLDLHALWQVTGGLGVQLKVLNATDRDVQPLRDYQGLGRQAWLVLRWEGAL
jgi:vitamin B12 transporter